MKSRIRGLLDSPVWPAMRLVYKASPKHSVVTTASIVIQALLGLSGILISGNLMGAIALAESDGMDAARDQLVLFVGLGIGVALVSTGLGVLNDAVSGGLGLRFYRLTRAMAMDASLSPKGIAHLEDPKFMDELKVAQGQDYASHPTQIVGAFSQILSSRVAAVGSAIMLFAFHWWAPLLLMAAMIVHYRWMNKELDAIWKPWTDSSPELRRSRYYRHLALDTPAAKEIRVFGLAPWVVDRFGERWFAGMNAVWMERKKLKGEMVRALVVLVIAFGVVYVVMAMDGATGRITIEQITIFAQATIGMYGFGAAGDSQLLLRNSSNSIKHLLALPKEAAERVEVNEGGTTETEAMPAQSIKFENVSFHYPGTERPVFDGLNLEIPSGKSLAIVGDNGAGKTTLVKLLARLYDPNSGLITVDGIDLKQIDPHAWRER
ncbi:MAG: ABC transporter ATP-binding protein/permease, partial [Actinomycetota bacterium]|nr:ABC transporter ATP-binding protein/permease [Actinomycetota bacterium]